MAKRIVKSHSLFDYSCRWIQRNKREAQKGIRKIQECAADRAKKFKGYATKIWKDKRTQRALRIYSIAERITRFIVLVYWIMKLAGSA